MKTKIRVNSVKQKTTRLFRLILQNYWAKWDKKWQQDFRLLEILADELA
jgi:hypothetical protein